LAKEMAYLLGIEDGNIYTEKQDFFVFLIFFFLLYGKCNFIFPYFKGIFTLFAFLSEGACE
jgi:hypothetical protein